MADSKRKTANLVDISTYTASGGQSSKYEYFKNVTLSAGTYTYSCRQNNTLSYATRNTLFVAIDANLTYESTATDYHLNVGIHSLTFTLESEKTIILGCWTNTLSNDCVYDEFMLNTGSTPLPYEPYGWQHSLRKLATATDTITTLPADLYADGTNATVGLKGNMQQTGTPAPQTPIQPSETGDRTPQVMPSAAAETKELNGVTITCDGNGTYTVSGTATADVEISFTIPEFTIPISVGQGGNGTLSFFNTLYNSNSKIIIKFLNGDTLIDSWSLNAPNRTNTTYSALGDKRCNKIALRVTGGMTTNGTFAIMFTDDGQLPLTYIPYGYKLTISSANTTTPVYLGEVLSTRRIKKYEFTGNESYYAYNYGGTSGVQVTYILDSNKSRSQGYCNIYPVSTSAGTAHCVWLGSGGGDRTVYFVSILSDMGMSTIDEFKSYVRQQYAAGTPVTIWYVLATETRGILNEPLRKIGTYADEVSGITIPTITGKDTFDVQTTLKPSEVELTYTGWHDAEVKEWDDSDWA